MVAFMQDWKQTQWTGRTQQSKNSAPGDSLRSYTPNRIATQDGSAYMVSPVFPRTHTLRVYASCFSPGFLSSIFFCAADSFFNLCFNRLLFSSANFLSVCVCKINGDTLIIVMLIIIAIKKLKQWFYIVHVETRFMIVVFLEKFWKKLIFQ